jgi:tetratricopeptide (TPR) repeat protein
MNSRTRNAGRDQGDRNRPLKIFISSTYEDLRPYVRVAETVLRNEGFEFDHFKHWDATGRPTVPECKERVQKCNALIVLVGSTYGWVPSIDQGGDGESSITRLEVRWAREKPMPVLPYFVRPRTKGSGATPSGHDRGLDDFVDELQKTLGSFVSSVNTFGETLRHRLVTLRAELRVTKPPPAVGEPRQGRYRVFHDRSKARKKLRKALSDQASRGVMIVGKGGFGKSALANCAIDELRQSRQVDTVIYLHPLRDTAAFDGHDLFMSAMEASGQPKMAYEASWTSLSSNPTRLVEVVLKVYQEHCIVLLLDAFERNLDDDGAIEPPIVRSFIERFVATQHRSKLLITTREAPVQPALENVEEIPLDEGLRISDSIALLKAQLPSAAAPKPEDLKNAVRAVSGIPFAVERLALLVKKNPTLKLGGLSARGDVLDQFVRLAHSTLSDHARMTLQARSIFDEPVPEEALIFVLSPEVSAADVQSAIGELARGHFIHSVESGLLDLHDIDKESSYRSLAHDTTLDLLRLHRRAADFFARDSVKGKDGGYWSSYDQLKNDVSCFRHLVRAGDPVAAANVFDAGKLWFLNWAGHMEIIGPMFKALDLREERTRAALMKKFALADALVVLGPFDKAVPALKSTIELARELGETDAELAATYDLGLALRYSGQGDEAATTLHSLLAKAREGGDGPWLGRSLFGYSLACTYSGRYSEAIRAGIELGRYARHVEDAYYTASSNSCLCIAYYIVGRMPDARTCAAAAAQQLVNTVDEHMVGFSENVHGLALHALGKNKAAGQAFHRARIVARRTAQRRAEGLAATNWAWLLYSRGAVARALEQISDAVRIFTETSPPDTRLVQLLREAFESADANDVEQEAQALWNFVRSDYVNPDLIRTVAVAEHILSLGDRAPTNVRDAAASFVASERIRIDAVLNDLERRTMSPTT